MPPMLKPTCRATKKKNQRKSLMEALRGMRCFTAHARTSMARLLTYQVKLVPSQLVGNCNGVGSKDLHGVAIRAFGAHGLADSAVVKHAYLVPRIVVCEEGQQVLPSSMRRAQAHDHKHLLRARAVYLGPSNEEYG
jgi:hypothetical protein